MQSIEPTGELKELLHKFESIGGVVQYALVKPDAWDKPVYDIHREAAIFTVQASEREFLEGREALVALYGSSIYNPRYEPDKIQGRQSELAEFTGPYFDLDSNRLLLRGRNSKHLNDFFLAGDKEKPESIIHRPGMYGKARNYAYAFSHPPYGLSYGDNKRLTAPELNELFLALNKALFGGFEAELTIFEWSTDWATFFDAGHEWWGSFLWTVQNKTQDYIIGIAASSTD
jgi:hypothetical protein